MTLEQATQLALRIRDHYSRLDVVAIGRFLPVEELDAQPERWGITIRIDGSECKRIWADDALVYYADATPAKRPAAKKPKKPEPSTAGMLF